MALGCDISVGTGKLTGVPPLFNVMVTPSIVTEDVLFGTGYGSVRPVHGSRRGLLTGNDNCRRGFRDGGCEGQSL